ncbi:MAG: sulfur carrier protein ThiS [Pseudomonadota bacterium]|nr:MAG: sulfur carrier protein ThiS [Pseudomonadota bacterium]
METSIVLNGEARRFPAPVTIAQLLQALGLSGQRVAVEVNRDIVPRSQHATHVLRDDDRVEVVRAIGGG